MTDIQKRVEKAVALEKVANKCAADLDVMRHENMGLILAQKAIIQELTARKSKAVKALEGYREQHRENAETNYFLKAGRIDGHESIDCGCKLCEEAEATLEQLQGE